MLIHVKPCIATKVGAIRADYMPSASSDCTRIRTSTHHEYNWPIRPGKYS